MAKENKSIIEEALLNANLLREAISENTREILRSVAKEEISGIVNESLNEDFDEEEVSDEENEFGDLEVDTEDDTDTDSEVEEFDVDGGDVSDEDEFEVADDEPAVDDLAVSPENGSDDYEGMEGIESPMDDLEYDMTSASDEDVIAVFKKLSGSDEIEIIDDNEVHIKDPESGSEYHVKLNGKKEAPAAVGMDAETEVEDSFDFGGEDEDAMEYEVELDGEEDEVEETVSEEAIRDLRADKKVTNGSTQGREAGEDADSGDNLEGGFDDDATDHANAEGPMVLEDEEDEISEDEEICEDDLDEAIPVGNAESRRVAGMATPIKGAGARGRNMSESKYNKLMGDYKNLVQENTEFKKALKEFRDMINEVAIFNSNLTYATKLFTEHSTTQEEKKEILKRFDSDASSMKDSKKVYKTIQEGLRKRTPLKESVGNKLAGENKTSSKSQINESTAYTDPSTARMLELMQKVGRR